MKPRALLYAPLVLLDVAVLVAPQPVLDAERESPLRGSSQGPDRDASKRVLLQHYPEAERPSAAEAVQDSSCSVAPNILRPENMYNDPSVLRFEDANACCHACRQEDRCLSWSYDSLTGACALKDGVSKAYNTSSSDEGRFLSSGGPDISQHVRSTYRDSGYAYYYRPYATAARGTVDRRARAAYNTCVAGAGVAYPRGTLLRQTTTASHKDCCELCRKETECFSWHRNADTKTCVLNKDVPSKAERGKHYAGATVI